MKGFFRRDFYLVIPNARFYALFVIILAVLSLWASGTYSLFSFYIALFSSSTILGLFSYDEADRWNAYASALPDGRRAMVNARYVLSMAVTALVLVTIAGVGTLTGGGFVRALGTAALFAGLTLVYLAFALPISYRFGNGKGRLILIVFIAIAAGMMGGLITVVDIGSAAGAGREVGIGGALLLLGGLAAMAVSWFISCRIMAKKEF